MTRQAVLRALLAFLFLSISAEMACANSGSAVLIILMPGFAIFSPLLGIPVTMAAALLEWPFVSLAGIRRYALTRSLRANLLSWLAGNLFLVFLVTSGGGDFLVLLCFALAIPISILIEGSYYKAVLARQGGALRWSWVVAANIFSNAVVLLATFDFASWSLRLAQMSARNEETVGWITAAISLALVVFAFRLLREPVQAAPEASQPATEADSPREEFSTP